MLEKIKKIISQKKYEYFGIVEKKDTLKRELKISHTSYEGYVANIYEWQNYIYLQLKNAIR